MSNLLICDDEKDIVNALEIYCKSEGYTVYKAYHGREALEVLQKEEIHLVLLDVMMPVMDGIQTLAKIREYSNVPVILLTAKSEDTDKILGLNIGADDYITKPFQPMEVLARVKSQLRRYMVLGGQVQTTQTDLYKCGNIELNDETKEVLVDGEPVNLTRTEFEICKLLMSEQGKVFSPKQIYEKVWKGAALGAEGTVAVHIRHLREKIEINPAEPRYLKVVWGQGYVMGKRLDEISQGG